MSTLSNRGRALIPETQSSPQNNPDDIDFTVAENMLSINDTKDKLNESPETPHSYLTYGSSRSFKRVAADFMNGYVFKREVPEEHFIIVNGCALAIETTVHALCDPGEEVWTFGPGYGRLKRLVEGRSSVRLVTVPLDTNPDRIEVADLEKMWEQRMSEDIMWEDNHGLISNVKMVLVCSPNNPTGEVLSKKVVKELAEWGASKKIHMVFDEIYANSVFAQETDFVSVVEAMDGNLGEYAHVVWSFSKDFCLSGCRVGLIYSQNHNLLRLGDQVDSIVAPSGQTLWGLKHMLADTEWVSSYIQRNKERLRERYNFLALQLNIMRIPHMRPEAGLFVWIDLGKWMRNRTEEEENVLLQRFAREKVRVTPSRECLGRQFGYFRLCYASVDIENLRTGLHRIEKALPLG